MGREEELELDILLPTRRIVGPNDGSYSISDELVLGDRRATLRRRVRGRLLVNRGSSRAYGSNAI
jgi:hypothetical protein